jgi:MoaA/NifB/PqqE/SkfB family radical SAM enzyme
MPQKVSSSNNKPADGWKLWLYTNYDCHLACSYCVVASHPKAERRPLGLDNVKKLIDDAVQLGFGEVFFTGGEPFILNDIYAMLEYALQYLPTTILTTGALLKGSRLARLKAIAHPDLTLQVSLDGGRAEHHDAYRGHGTWAKTVAAVERLSANGFDLRLSTTETPANSQHLDLICELHNSLGIQEEHHFIRPLAKRGFSTEGIEVSMKNLQPELTVNAKGVFWHPLSQESDMQVSKSIFPLVDSVRCIKEQLEIIANGGEPRITFT